MFTITEFLREEVKPALGCTEPGAVALAAAKAKEQLDVPVEKLNITVSNSIFKNGIAVGIPGTGGMRGNEIAAAIAVFCGKSEYGLEVLKDVTEKELEQAKQFIADGRLSLKANGKPGVYVMAEAVGGGHAGVAVIRDSHANITEVKRDGTVIFSVKEDEQGADHKNLHSIAAQVANTDFDELVALADTLSPADVDYVWNGVEMNRHISDFGMEHEVGLALGRGIRESSGAGYENDIAAQIKAISAAASDARMAGELLPVMSSAGSGNHGITAILPVWIIGERNGKSREEIAAAIAYSHLATSYVKSRMGRLSPVCGCAVAAGAGAAAGIVKLLGGSNEQAQHAMEMVIGNIVGMVCDGAKETCSLKVGTGASEGYYAAMMALSGRRITASAGVIDSTNFARTVDNASRLNREGMAEADSTIINIIAGHGRK